MCTNIDLDISPELLVVLKKLALQEVGAVVNDECSPTILEECEPVDFDTLASAVGETILNSIIVDVIKRGIEYAEEQEDET